MARLGRNIFILLESGQHPFSVLSRVYKSCYAREVYFCNFVAKSNNPIQHAPNIHLHVFNSFLRTILHGEFHRIFTGPSTLGSVSTRLATHFFFIRTLRTIEKQIHILPSRETIPNAELNSDVLSIRPLIYIRTD